MSHISEVVDAVPNIRLSTASLNTRDFIEKVTDCRRDIGLNSSKMCYTGVPVGATQLMPDGKYTPEISVANFSQKEAHVLATYAVTAGDDPRSLQVGTLTVPPGTTRYLVLRGLEGESNLQNSFVVASHGAPGSVMSKLVSMYDSQLHEVELQAKDELDMENAGNHP